MTKEIYLFLYKIYIYIYTLKRIAKDIHRKNEIFFYEIYSILLCDIVKIRKLR